MDTQVSWCFISVDYCSHIGFNIAGPEIPEYNCRPLGSREYTLRLLAITPASLHALAGKIYASSHPNIEMHPQKPPEGHYRAFRGTDRFYVDFFHVCCFRFEDHPLGLLDVVGYWTESQLLGGVILFDRGDSGSEVR